MWRCMAKKGIQQQEREKGKKKKVKKGTFPATFHQTKV